MSRKSSTKQAPYLSHPEAKPWDSVLEQITTTTYKLRKKQGVEYIELPCAFDIETTSFYQDGEKRATMYIWQFGINGQAYIGRTWDEFISFMELVKSGFNLSMTKRLLIYVHNLAYEFQWIRFWFEWMDVFATSTRTPLKAVTADGFEFRCSYLLTGKSLKQVGEELKKYKVYKTDGLDYSKPRHSFTPLTSTELEYCINDVLVVMAYIQEQIEAEGNILRIPLTKTGYVRRHTRNKCLDKTDKKAYWKYIKLMKRLILDEKQFNLLLRGFQGGYTHECPHYFNQICQDAGHIDFTSAYPWQFLKPIFPIGAGEWIDITTMEELERACKYYALVFDVKFVNLQSKVSFDNYISYSHCWSIKNPIVNNGRVYSADEATTTLTDLDWDIIKRMYTWESIQIGACIRYVKGYLPKQLILSMLELYKDKTELKGLEDAESVLRYQQAKELLNSTYGMMVQNPCKDLATYEEGEWGHSIVNKEEKLQKYNEDFSRFLFYGWGIFVTAGCRHDLFTGIFEFANYYNEKPYSDYIYADTDSIFATNMKDHKEYLDKYNAWVRATGYKCMDHYDLQHELIEPCTIKGEKKLLGSWDIEDMEGLRFKSLGAKRYLFEKKDKLTLTVSGLNKKRALPYLLDQAKNDHTEVFNMFKDGMYIPPEHTGKLTHSYIDYETSGTLTDYLGVEASLYEKSCIHLEPQEYSLSIAPSYEEFILTKVLTRRLD